MNQDHVESLVNQGMRQANSVSIADIDITETEVIALTERLKWLVANAPRRSSYDSETYNHLGTLKVNLSSLERQIRRAMDAIKISI